MAKNFFQKLNKKQKKNLFFVLAVVTILDFLIPDPIPLFDEVLLLFFTWKTGIEAFP